MLNTHEYDGKLASDYYEPVRNMHYTREYDDYFAAAAQYFAKAHGLEVITRNRFGNYDTSDNLDSSILLIIIHKMALKNDMTQPEAWMIEQINDILGGQCLQGRSKRLSQIYCALYESLRLKAKI